MQPLSPGRGTATSNARAFLDDHSVSSVFPFRGYAPRGLQIRSRAALSNQFGSTRHAPSSQPIWIASIDGEIAPGALVRSPPRSTRSWRNRMPASRRRSCFGFVTPAGIVVAIENNPGDIGGEAVAEPSAAEIDGDTGGRVRVTETNRHANVGRVQSRARVQQSVDGDNVVSRTPLGDERKACRSGRYVPRITAPSAPMVVHGFAPVICRRSKPPWM